MFKSVDLAEMVLFLTKNGFLSVKTNRLTYYLFRSQVSKMSWEIVYNIPTFFEGDSYILRGAMHYITHYRNEIEIGYVVLPSGDVYKIERDVGPSFTLTHCKNKRLLYTPSNFETETPATCCLVSK